MKRDTYDVMILAECDGKNSILDISKIIGLSYQTTFKRVKALANKKEIILSSPSVIGDKSVLTINPEKRKEIDFDLLRYHVAKDRVSKFLKDSSSREDVKDYLSYIKNNRFASPSNYLSELTTKGKAIPFDIMLYVRELGLTRERLEITKAGSRVLKDLKNYKEEKNK